MLTDDMICLLFSLMTWPASHAHRWFDLPLQLVAFESAFTIEGRAEEELPEVVLGVGKFNKMDVQKGLELQY